MSFHCEVDSVAAFFAPVSVDIFDALIAEYNGHRAKINELADLVFGSGYRTAVAAFIEGNAGDEKLHRSIYVDKLFAADGAIKALNSQYWKQALALTDVYELMPQARKDAWNEDIRKMTTPDFTDAAVRPTIVGLLNMRAQFLAEKVDGVFRGLSGQHVTNSPEAFGRRLIIAGVLDSYGHVDHSKAGLVHDLRCVVARFMGRGDPNRSLTFEFLEQTRTNPGSWLAADGGALRVRTYKNGNAHMEVHAEMAWRLNSILAHLYPTAIPSQFRQKPKRQPKVYTQLLRPLPFPILELLARCLSTLRYAKGNYIWFDHDSISSPHLEGAICALESVGGTRDSERRHWVNFAYPPETVLREIVATGCLPDQATFQFHQTSERLAKDAVAWAEVGDSDRVLEPSAGQGAIAAHLPAARLQCVELSSLHCAVLRARGFTADEGDFIAWSDAAAQRGRLFDVVVMNPPFSDGRAQLHVERAYRLLAPGGRLVAVVPGSLNGRQFLSGVEIEYSRAYESEFETASVSVLLMRARCPGIAECSPSSDATMQEAA
ncbi:TPA: DUF4942 domain-containing protein [Burkholderia cepacia]|jgi:hypothetical protein|uniref:DUF4942 domain-containing protein n=3 Tax=Burkholderia cepacia complex TaxID=87882 RepID=A0A250LL02_9BURK|nr:MULTISPECIES: DUF4942 domain-containing protein [Burkholderia]KKL36537.1 hypothetical protein WR31_25535 [Burkholderia contaminans LMG 23361]MBA9831144.1 DUF4942 domain-containing protein [Burkholderia contaminans]MBA9839202.1 DUF4942 domain-containing protein [Burkholderia contaminans]MBA9864512.1 DUF4942 domain-containing protein [Burkholderia contaminans]MBA9906784.1 DUF4942 domain-containing protein [Burkholderia contaminans]